MTELIAPLVPSDLDVRDFGYMPLEVVRLRDSEIAIKSSGEEFRAAVMLWAAAWHQVPAGSLPDDDEILARLALYGRDLRGWRKARAGALHGFKKATDGRFYHPTICMLALDADSKRRNQQRRTKNATEARMRSSPNRDVQRDEERNDERDVQRNEDRDEANSCTKGIEGKGIEGIKKESSSVVSQGETHSEVQAKPNGEAQASEPPTFPAFWAVYPTRDGPADRKGAVKAYRAALKRGVTPEILMSAAQAYAAKLKAKGKLGTEFVAQARTWLNGDRWNETNAAARNPENGLTADQEAEYRRTLGWD